MESRESRYSSDNAVKTVSRQEKNQALYEEINEKSIDNFKVFSNATVIANNETNQIDVNKIKKILDNKYNEVPKRKSIKIEESVYEPSQVEETKEYDINAILDKAKSEKVVSYEEERIKKPSTTQYEILKNLEINKEQEETEQEETVVLSSDEPKELLDLINTIVINEKKLKEENNEIALDLLEDLKEDEEQVDEDKTKETKNELEKEKQVEEKKDDIKESAEEEKSDKVVEKIDLNDEEEDIFVTRSTKFKKSDFESLDDEKEGNLFIKILLILLLIGFIVGMYFFLTTFLNI